MPGVARPKDRIVTGATTGGGDTQGGRDTQLTPQVENTQGNTQETVQGAQGAITAVPAPQSSIIAVPTTVPTVQGTTVTVPTTILTNVPATTPGTIPGTV